MADDNGAAERRQRGLAKMAEVYGWDVQDGPGDFFSMTVEHLFAEVWDRPALTVRERRLLLIGLLAGQNMDDVLGLQLEVGHRLGELSVEQLREIVIIMAHYGGWPTGAKLNSQVEALIAKTEKAAKTEEA